MNLDIKSLRQCIYCHNFCKFSCPSYLASRDQKIIQNQKNYLLYLYGRKDIEADEEFGKSVYLCNDCRRCETYCIYDDKNVLENNRYSKAEIFKAGFAPRQIYKIEKNLIRTGNIYGLKYKTANDQPDLKQYDIFIYSGDFIRSLEPQIFESFKRLLRKLKISYVYDCNEISDGIIPLELGMEKISEELMKINYNRINRFNFDKLVVLDPYSYRNLREEYKKFGFKFDCEIMHYTEYIESLVCKVSVFKTGDKLKYFDPCKLGRGMKIYEPPRNILKKLFDASEIDLYKNRAQSYCCGGYISLFDKNIASLIASDVVSDFFDSGYDVLLSACPLCLHNLKSASQNNKIKTVRIYDILEYISLNLKM